MNLTKTCKKCGIDKPINKFHKCRGCKDGRRLVCIVCAKKYKKRYRENNKEKISTEKGEYYQKNKNKLSKKSAIYYTKNRTVLLKKGDEWRKNNKEYSKEYGKIYYQENKEEQLRKKKKHYRNNKDCINECVKKYREKNKEKILIKKKEYREEKREEIAIKGKKYYLKNKEKMLVKNKEYNKSVAGKLSKSKFLAKRKRELGYTPLNNRFEGSEGHHVDNERVIFIPSEMHRSNPHRQSDPETMIEINRLAFDYLENGCCGKHN